MTSIVLHEPRQSLVRTPLPLRRGEESPLRRYVAADPRSREMREQILRSARADVPALVCGEAGTGRRLIARILHAESPRAGHPLVLVGAQAASVDKDAGAWLATAGSGVLVLDQIEALPRPFLDSLTVAMRSSPTGAVRLLAISLHSAAELAARRLVPADLLVHLQAGELVVPALRHRPGDIAPIAERYARSQAQRFARPPVSLEPTAAARLLEHSWPGNVRELESVVLKALAARPGPRLYATDLRIAAGTARCTPLQELVLRLLDEGAPDLHATVLETLLMTAYARSGRNQVRTARSLGISRNVLRTQLAQLGVIKARRRATHGLSRE